VDKIVSLTKRLFETSPILQLCPYLGEFAKLTKAIISFVTSVRPHETTRLPLDGF
jgi:hypothetical protein